MRPNTIIGVDISYDIRRGLGYCAAVIVDITKLKVLKYSITVDEVKIPYIPGYLAFREAPLIFKTLKNLDEELVRGSILMINGHGIAHPRRFGIASHIGVV
ncbi:MAG: endonuclease V, partial [Sulfolobales archaeon]